MTTRSWKHYARAACLIIAAGLACQAAAAGLGNTRGRGRCAAETVVRGRGLITFGGYELNVTFTTGGRLVGFDVTDAAPSRPPA